MPAHGKRSTGSVTGQQGWEWNRNRAHTQHAATPSSTRPVDQTNEIERNCTPEEENAILRRRLAKKEIEIDQLKRRNQEIIDQYENVVAKKNRQLEDRDRSRLGYFGQNSLVSKLVRVVFGH